MLASCFKPLRSSVLGRGEYVAATDEADDAFRYLSRTEGVILVIESV